MRLDRKSTRLNSSHVSISYAVFCLKKKKKKNKQILLQTKKKKKHKKQKINQTKINCSYEKHRNRRRVSRWLHQYKHIHFFFYGRGRRGYLNSFPTRRSSD